MTGHATSAEATSTSGSQQTSVSQENHNVRSTDFAEAHSEKDRQYEAAADLEAAHPRNNNNNDYINDDDDNNNNRVDTLGVEKVDKAPGLAERSLRITWAWFPVNMSTGAFASLLAQQPYTFRGLQTIGKIFYLVNVVLFTFFLILIVARFARKPRALSTSLHHPSESFFFGAFWVAVALLLLGAQSYGVPETGPWLVKALRVLYWMYFASATLVAIFQYNVIFHVEKLTVADAMPAWVLPAYPFLVSGTLASNIAKTQSPESALQIVISGIAGQGLGWILAVLIYTVYLTRLINSAMPAASVRPGMYVSVGPAAYTCAGLVSLGQQAQKVLPQGFLGITSVPVGDLWYALSVPAALFLWLIAVWFSALSSLSVIRGVREMTFSLQWWAFVFPNAGLALATIRIGDALGTEGIKIVGTIITIMLVPLWFLCAIAHIRAVWTGQLMYPGKDLGVDDVNWAHDSKKESSRKRKQQRRENRQWTRGMLKDKRNKE